MESCVAPSCEKSNKYSNNTLDLTSLFWADDWQSGGILGALSLLPTRVSNAKSQLVGDALNYKYYQCNFQYLCTHRLEKC